MRSFLLSVFLFASTWLVASPVIFYSSYADYKAKKGTNMGEFKEYSILNGMKNYLRVINKEGKKITYGNKELGGIWGMEMEGALYRFVKGFNAGQLFEAIYIGEKISVFEDAYPRISAANDGKSYSSGKDPAPLYFTPGAEGEITQVKATLKKKIKEDQKAEFPQFAPVFDCLEKEYQAKYDQKRAIQCFIDFNGK